MYNFVYVEAHSLINFVWRAGERRVAASAQQNFGVLAMFRARGLECAGLVVARCGWAGCARLVPTLSGDYCFLIFDVG